MSSTDLSAWLGKQQTVVDRMDPGHAARIAVTLGDPIPEAGMRIPPLWHWAFFLETVPIAQTGLDGHPARGSFLPPADNRNRMWSGGRVSFNGSLEVGIEAQKTSTVTAIQEKKGRTGSLLFVTVKHDIEQRGKLVVSEEQDIVYREPSPPKLQGTEPVRYSAVTFNSHRIHYDHPYVTQTEGYPGLVIHGPLIATMMCRAFAHAHPNAALKHLSYRGLRPLIAPKGFSVAGAVTAPGEAKLWAEQDATLAHQAELRFEA
ncbi:MAG: MaoC family dehydratase N-terminal domain-containing protein [Burkholderiales bacterium]|nr:MaoC family dehydratase N-terminal domain-containing protein [Burkholderiales bacterium]